MNYPVNKIRISAVSYTNTKPFIYGLQHTGILEKIDQEIARLREVLALLRSDSGTAAKAPAKRRGRPPKAVPGKAAAPRAKRQLSVESRARIAAGQKKRWAAQKKDENE